MPDRYLSEALLTSERWNDLNASAQCFYIRLMLVVDDFGCFDGRENVIAHACYPTARVDVSELLVALHAADLICRYSNAGKPYVALMRWRNDLRGKRRFPAPPINNDAPEMPKPVRGKYSRPIGWKNPGGSDPVSVLLDAQMRPAVPQPREWRLVDKDYAPAELGAQALDTMVRKDYAPVPVHQRSAGTVLPEVEAVAVPEKKAVQTQTQPPEPPRAAQHGEQGLTATATPTNGSVELTDNGEWRGLTEAQRLKWQDMFASLSVPDQLDRAAQWLIAHPDERRAYERDHGLEQYLIRWLLREARPH